MPAPTFTNASFETASATSAALPDGWTLDCDSSSWVWGVFSSILYFGEDFESGWSSNEDRRDVFGVGELDDSTFDATAPEAIEDFEEEWSSNENRKDLFSGGQLDDASFDSAVPEDTEDFEEEWSSNEDRRDVFGVGELDDASIDAGTPEAVEDFEEEWSDNENRRSAFGGGELDDASIETYSGTSAYDSFDDGIQLDLPMTVSVGAEHALEPTMGVRVSIAGTFSGTAEIQVKRVNTFTWFTHAEITTGGGIHEVEAGYQAIRLERTGGGAGATAVGLWPHMP